LRPKNLHLKVSNWKKNLYPRRKFQGGRTRSKNERRGLPTGRRINTREEFKEGTK